MSNLGCPSAEELERSITGDLPADRAEVLAQHLETCESCARKLAGTPTPNSVAQPIQDSPDVTQPMELSILMRRLLQMRQTPIEPPTDNSFAKMSGSGSANHPINDYPFLKPARGTGEIGWLGSYRVLRLLGQGGMGIVFEAEDQQLHRHVALKVMRPELAEDANVRARFLAEARAMAAVVHENVVKIYQIGQAGDVPYLAMEFLTGESLARRLRHGPAIPLADVIRIGNEIAVGLAAAHQQGLIHRDIKPDNVFLEAVEQRGDQPHTREAHTGLRVKLLDFGLAFSVAGQGVADEHGIVLGTPAFMSPEQALGKTVDERSDLFSLGCVLYRMVTGKLPFEGSTPVEILQARVKQSAMSAQLQAPGVPQPLAQLIDELLAANPARRPASVQIVADELAKLLPKPAQLTSGQKVVAAAVALTAVVATLILGTLNSNPQNSTTPSSAPANNSAAANDSSTPADSSSTPVTTEPQRAELDPAWLDRVRQLEPTAQIAEVVAELQRRNPGYDGKYEENHAAEFVRRIHFHSDYVADISPIRAFPELHTLFCAGSSEGKGILEDLSPVKGMRLGHIDCGWTKIRDLEPLRGMRLTGVQASLTQISDLKPLEGMPLKELQIGGTKVADLSVLGPMSLRLLSCWGTPVRDLEPIRGCPTLLTLELSNSQVTDLSPLRGCPIKHLTCELDGVKDWSVLGELPLETVRLNYVPELHKELLSKIPTLTSINYRSAPKFLENPTKKPGS